MHFHHLQIVFHLYSFLLSSLTSFTHSASFGQRVTALCQVWCERLRMKYQKSEEALFEMTGHDFTFLWIEADHPLLRKDIQERAQISYAAAPASPSAGIFPQLSSRHCVQADKRRWLLALVTAQKRKVTAATNPSISIRVLLEGRRVGEQENQVWGRSMWREVAGEGGGERERKRERNTERR